jgi:biopolymer transport protein ExbB/TolQ
MARIKSRAPSELLFSLFALIIVTIGVHAVYVAVVRPKATAVLNEQRAAMKKDPDFVAERSMYVVLKDWEQESEIILALWAFAISDQSRSRRDAACRPDCCTFRRAEDSSGGHAGARRSSAATRRPSSCRAGGPGAPGATCTIRRSDARHACARGSRSLDSELSMLRYIAWAIPAIGFIGTVRGIGDALGQAHRAVTGDVSGVTEGLGTAFNSTLVALLLSIVLMFLLHQLQLAQERLVLDSETYLDRNLIRHMQVR